MELRIFRVKVQRLIGRILGRTSYSFLDEISGLIHVGANVGQERMTYDRYDIDVVWIEPIPEIFKELQDNLATFPRQQAFQYLVANQDNEIHQFNVANNGGQSSSIFRFNLHSDIWPEVSYTHNISLQSITLASLIKQEKINISRYDALVIDAQGSELLVLEGASDLLSAFKFIKTEVADFEAYEGACQLSDVKEFLLRYGFLEHSRHEIALRRQGGAYYDLIFKRESEYSNLNDVT